MLPDSKSLKRAMDQISIALSNLINRLKIKVKLRHFTTVNDRTTKSVPHVASLCMDFKSEVPNNFPVLKGTSRL